MHPALAGDAALHARLALLLILVCTNSASAQAPTPLVWGADLDGGVPYIFDQGGMPAGFEVDIKDALARELGRPIEFRQKAFDSLLLEVQDGGVDLAMNGLEITPEREQLVRFSRPYYLYQLQLVARRGEQRFTTLAECKKLNLTVGTLDGCAADRLLDELQIAKRGYQDQLGPYLDLQQKAIDAVLLDLPIALYYAAPIPQLKHNQRVDGLQFVGSPFGAGYYGIAIRKDNSELANQVNQALQRIVASGELKRILVKWELWNVDQYRLLEADQSLADDEDGVPRAEAGEGVSLSFYLPMLLEGAAVTVLLTLVSMAGAIALGLPIALGRLYGPAPVRGLATLYVEFFRGIPVLLLLYFIYYGIPGIWPALKMHPLIAAVIGFALNYAAYEAEIYRAGISSVSLGQWEAAASLGMGRALTFRRIIFPQAFRLVLPPMTNDLIALFKDTSVVSIISVVELSKQYQILTKSYGGFFEIGVATAALYLLMSVPLGYVSRYLEHRTGGKL